MDIYDKKWNWKFKQGKNNEVKFIIDLINEFRERNSKSLLEDFFEIYRKRCHTNKSEDECAKTQHNLSEYDAK